MPNIPELNMNDLTPEAIKRYQAEMLAHAAGMVIAAEEDPPSRFEGVPVGKARMYDGNDGGLTDIVEGGSSVTLVPTASNPDGGFPRIQDASDEPLITTRQV